MLRSFRTSTSALIGLVLFSLLFVSVSANSAPLLWRLENSESGARVYLFGALHYGAEKFYPLPEPVLAAYEDARILAVELNLDSLSPQYVRQVTVRQGHYPKGRQLSEELSPRLWAKLSERALSLGLEPTQLLPLKPWLAALQLVNLQVSASEFEQRLGLDRHFLKRAERDAKAVHQLETLEQQMALFSSLSAAEQTDFLAQTLREFDNGQAQLTHLAEAWHRGDERALAKAILGAFNDEPFSKHLYQKVFAQRNRAMAEMVSNYLEEGARVFFVVGVGHMVGEEGLVALLQARGYTLERL